MKLCIAEKPSVGREIALILGAKNRKDGYMEGNGYIVTWTFGHLCELQQPHEYSSNWKYWNMNSLPMIPKRFRIRLIENEGIKKQFEIIKQLIIDAECVINCGDAGQEGELIQRWVLQKSGCNVPVKRLWISSLTEEAIKDGFNNLSDSTEFDSLYAAGSARAIGDWLLGMNMTRAYTLKYGNGKNVLSIGRVQTPTLALVVNRQKEIENFVPTPYWEVKTNYRDTVFTYVNGRFDIKEEAVNFLEAIQGKDIEIKDIVKKKSKESPPKLFDLTLLQVEANRKYSFSAEHTLKVIQALYEKKFTSYPRVDTNFLPNTIYDKVGNILKGLKPYGEIIKPILEAKKIIKSKKVFNDKKITDHHAIIPTGIFSESMSPDEKRIYDMVARRFIAVFYPDCEFANTNIDAIIEDKKFKANGKLIVKPGWRDVFKDNKLPTDKILPEFTKGERGEHNPELAEKETVPPKYFTEADLLRAMETAGKNVDDEELRDLMKANGIGRPSTRANIIETLIRRKYIYKEKKRILATNTGMELVDTISNELLKSAELTGIWEKKLRMIENQEYKVEEFMLELRKMVIEVISEVKSADKKVI